MTVLGSCLQKPSLFKHQLMWMSEGLGKGLVFPQKMFRESKMSLTYPWSWFPPSTSGLACKVFLFPNPSVMGEADASGQVEAGKGSSSGPVSPIVSCSRQIASSRSLVTPVACSTGDFSFLFIFLGGLLCFTPMFVLPQC